MNKRKGITTKISEQDQALIKYIYLNYDPEEVQEIQLIIKERQRLLKNHFIGYVKLKQNNNQSENNHQNNFQIEIKMLDAGSVKKVSNDFDKVVGEQYQKYVLKKNLSKKSVLNLFQMELCQHIPAPQILQKLIEQHKKQKEPQKSVKKSRKKQKNFPIFCQKCLQRLHYFYLSEELSITYKQIDNQFQLEDIEQIQKIEWAVKLSQSFTGNTQLAKYQDKQFKLNQGGKISYLIDWSTVEEVKNNLVILKYHPLFCQHEKIQDNICQYCLESVDIEQLHLKRYLFQMQQKDSFKRNMITAGSTLLEQQNQFIQGLLEKQKGLIILDLDNTILHAIELNQIHKSRLYEMQEYYHLVVNRQMSMNTFLTTTFIVKMRPFFKEFIETVVKYFEIYVYTKGTRIYAEQICNAIRNQYASKEHPTNNINNNLKYYDFLKDKNAFFYNRIITRDEDPNLENKSLDNILPTRQDNVLVMDDLGKVWGYSYAVLYTIPYHFFYKKKQIKMYEQKRNKTRSKTNLGSLIRVNQDPESYVSNTLQITIDQIQMMNQKTQILEPIKELPCDHLERQINEIQNLQVQEIVHSNSNHIPILDIPQFIDLKQTQILKDQDFQSDILPKKDYYLLYAAYNLLEIHQKFFQVRKDPLNNKNKRIQISIIHKNYKNSLLEGTKIKFVSKNEHKISVLSHAAKKMGCIVIDQNNSSEKPDYLIRLNNLSENDPKNSKPSHIHHSQISVDMIEKVRQIQKQACNQIKYQCQVLKIPLVSQTWIDYCFIYTYKFDIQAFIVDHKMLDSHIDEEEFQWVLEDNAAKILQKLGFKQSTQNIQKVN